MASTFIERDFDCCPCCGATHAAVSFRFFKSPSKTANYFGRCPRSGQKLYLKVEVTDARTTADIAD